tara:strand:+ start:1681 stop:2646 length:966 start_codon:yes stop_codon:yes gene_type:complete
MMMNTRQEAWGSFGTDAIGETAEEVCKNGGLDFTAELQTLYDMRGTALTYKHKGVFRTDTQECLGVVGKTYNVAQHITVAQLAHRLTQTKLLNWGKVGSINNGAKAWFNLELPDEIVINGKETIQTHLTLMNSHDGSSGIRVILGTYRVECGNQLNALVSQAKKASTYWTIRHTSKMEEAIEQMIEIIGMTSSLMDSWAENAQNMIETKMELSDRIDFYLDHLPIQKNDELVSETNPHGLATRGNNILDRVLELETESQNQIGDMNNTVWQALNTVTDYIDHDWVTSKNGILNAKRAESAIVGTGQRIKGKAWEAAVELLA